MASWKPKHAAAVLLINYILRNKVVLDYKIIKLYIYIKHWKHNADGSPENNKSYPMLHLNVVTPFQPYYQPLTVVYFLIAIKSV